MSKEGKDFHITRFMTFNVINDNATLILEQLGEQINEALSALEPENYGEILHISHNIVKISADTEYLGTAFVTYGHYSIHKRATNEDAKRLQRIER